MTTTLPKPAVSDPSRHMWTVEEYHRAAARGEFEDSNCVEIIHGEWRERMAQGPTHTNTRVRIARLLRRVLEPQVFVRDENPLTIAFDGEPVCDILVTRDEEYMGRHPHPEDVALLIEVAVTSVALDTGEKALLYAQAGIADYWVALPETGQLVVYREPSDTGYQSVTTLTGNATVAPLAASDAAFTVNTLLGE